MDIAARLLPEAVVGVIFSVAAGIQDGKFCPPPSHACPPRPECLPLNCTSASSTNLGYAKIPGKLDSPLANDTNPLDCPVQTPCPTLGSFCSSSETWDNIWPASSEHWNAILPLFLPLLLGTLVLVGVLLCLSCWPCRCFRRVRRNRPNGQDPPRDSQADSAHQCCNQQCRDKDERLERGFAVAESLKNETKGLMRQLRDVQRDLRAADAEKSQLKEDLKKCRENCTRLQSQIDDDKRIKAKLTKDLEDCEGKLPDAEDGDVPPGSLRQCREENSALRSRLTTVNEAVQRITPHLATVNHHLDGIRRSNSSIATTLERTEILLRYNGADSLEAVRSHVSLYSTTLAQNGQFLDSILEGVNAATEELSGVQNLPEIAEAVDTGSSTESPDPPSTPEAVTNYRVQLADTIAEAERVAEEFKAKQKTFEDQLKEARDALLQQDSSDPRSPGARSSTCEQDCLEAKRKQDAAELAFRQLEDNIASERDDAAKNMETTQRLRDTAIAEARDLTERLRQTERNLGAAHRKINRLENDNASLAAVNRSLVEEKDKASAEEIAYEQDFTVDSQAEANSNDGEERDRELEIVRNQLKEAREALKKCEEREANAPTEDRSSPCADIEAEVERARGKVTRLESKLRQVEAEYKLSHDALTEERDKAEKEVADAESALERCVQAQADIKANQTISEPAGPAEDDPRGESDDDPSEPDSGAGSGSGVSRDDVRQQLRIALGNIEKLKRFNAAITSASLATKTDRFVAAVRARPLEHQGQPSTLPLLEPSETVPWPEERRSEWESERDNLASRFSSAMGAGTGLDAFPKPIRRALRPPKSEENIDEVRRQLKDAKASNLELLGQRYKAIHERNLAVADAAAARAEAVTLAARDGTESTDAPEEEDGAIPPTTEES